MTIIEIFALIVALAVIIKIGVLMINPKQWIKLTEKIWKVPYIVLVVSLVLAGVVLYYLLKDLTIVHVFAVMLFIVLISAATLSVYIKDFLAIAHKFSKEKNFAKKAWIPILLWILLSIWVIKEIFM